MPDDPFVTFDAPYVLGALSPDDRSAFQQHLRTCGRCAEAVKELAGLPGLLSRAEINDPAADLGPAPDLLPGLLFAVRREQRNRRLLTVSGWVAAAACAVAVVVLALQPRTTPAPAGTLVAMTPLNGAPVAGQVSLTGVAWGTKIEVKCSYPEAYPAPGTYILVVVDKNGDLERVGSWKVIPGGTSTLNASTDIAAVDIGRLEVRSATDRTVLELVR